MLHQLSANSICDVKEKSKFKCFWPNCKYEATNSGDIVQHKFIHLNERQFVCDFSECNKTFIQRIKSLIRSQTDIILEKKAIQM